MSLLSQIIIYQMNTSKTQHVWPDGHWQKMSYEPFKEGMLDDKSYGCLYLEDNEADSLHLPNMKASTMVKCFAEFIQIQDVLRSHKTNNRASAEVIDDLLIIKKNLDFMLEGTIKKLNEDVKGVSK